MALEIFRLVGSVFVDTDEANKSLQKSDKDAESLGKRLTSVAQAAGKFAIGVVGAATAAGAALVAVAENTREYRTEQGKLQAAYETSGFAAGEAKSTYEALNSVLGDNGQAVEAATHLAKLCDNAEELQSWTQICTGVYATFGASLPIEGLTEAANETAKTGALTGGLADALNWAGVSEDSFQESLDKCATEQERQALITETLNGLYSEAADKYREVNADVIAANEANEKLSAVMAAVGAAVEPIITKGKVLIADVLEKAIPYIEQLATSVIPWLSDAISGVIQAVQDASSWMKEHETLITMIAIAIGTLTTAIIAYNVAQAIKNAGGIAEIAMLAALTVAETAHTVATTVATAATTAFSAAVSFLTSPVSLVIAAIGALIAIVVLLVQNWDTVKEAAIKCWEWIKQTWEKVASWFNEHVIQPIGKFFSGLWDSIKSVFGSVKTWFKDTFTSAWTAIKNVFSSWGSFFGNLWTQIKDKFSAIGTNIANAISSSVKAGINGVISSIERIINTGVSLINGAIGIINTIPGVNIGKLSSLSLPRLARGGVVDEPTVAQIGEDGAEAVVPLERNTGWIDRLSEKVAQSIVVQYGQGNSNVSLDKVLDKMDELLDALRANQVVTLNKREFARIVKAVG